MINLDELIILDDAPDPGKVELKLSPCGRILVSSGKHKMQIYDAETGNLVFEAEEGSNVTCRVLTPELVIFSRVINISSGKPRVEVRIINFMGIENDHITPLKVNHLGAMPLALNSRQKNC